MEPRANPKRKRAQKANHEIARRMCAACREKAPKRDMVRFVLVHGTPQLDEHGKMSGRGVNLCPKGECFDRAVKTGAFNRAWKTKLVQPDWQKLKLNLHTFLESRAFRNGRQHVVYRVAQEKLEATVT